MLSSIPSEERQANTSRDDRTVVKRVPQGTARTTSPAGEEKRRFVWVILLIIALIALALTILLGHFVLGPSDTLRR